MARTKKKRKSTGSKSKLSSIERMLKKKAESFLKAERDFWKHRYEIEAQHKKNADVDAQYSILLSLSSSPNHRPECRVGSGRRQHVKHRKWPFLGLCGGLWLVPRDAEIYRTYIRPQ